MNGINTAHVENRTIYRCILILMLFGIIFLSHSFALKAGEKEQYNTIKTFDLPLSNKQIKMCSSFLSKYPSSKNAQDVRIKLARNEKSPIRAFMHYEKILTEDTRDDIFDDAVKSACQISYLLSNYETCERICKKAIHRSTSSIKYPVVYLIRSNIMLQDYESANTNLVKYSSSISNEDISFFKNIISIHTGDNSSSAGSSLSDASLLYMAGRDFEFQSNRNYAYSAYKDLIAKYPRSPEALVCMNKVISMEKNPVKYTSEYLKKQKRPHLDTMSPDREIKDDPTDLFYSVLVGPFSSAKEARNIKKEMTEDFDGVVIVKNGKGFLVFVGSEPTAEMALSLKVRLAEEFGLNGKIVQRRDDNGREYIYGE